MNRLTCHLPGLQCAFKSRTQAKRKYCPVPGGGGGVAQGDRTPTTSPNAYYLNPTKAIQTKSTSEQEDDAIAAFASGRDVPAVIAEALVSTEMGSNIAIETQCRSMQVGRHLHSPWEADGTFVDAEVAYRMKHLSTHLPGNLRKLRFYE